MPVSPECCVLIPVSTLEDFPRNLNDDDARSLLAAWTVAWHPQMIAQSGQPPLWHRADAPPEPDAAVPAPTDAAEPDSADNSEISGDSELAGSPTLPFAGRTFIVPTSSLEQLPSGYADRARDAGARWITGANRNEMLLALGLTSSEARFDDQDHTQRTLGVADFFALGFTWLQIQVMTRRLRYTSNIDQVHFENRVVDAAEAFLEKRTSDSIDALHDAFDALAEERDHYFSSDPSLIDLVLVTGSTLESTAHLFSHPDQIAAPTPATGERDSSDPDSLQDRQHEVLATPANVLLDETAIESLDNPLPANPNSAAQTPPAKIDDFKTCLQDGRISWAAGGPAGDIRLDHLGYAAAANAFHAAHQRASQCIGAPPKVYGRLDGDTPVDLVGELTQLGYQGVIPLNFAAGTGHQEEAKLTLPSLTGDLEALTAKPMDASSDASFLDLGAKLGESIDGGEVATALLVHWPGQECDSFRDLRRAASWSLSLGKFWKLDEYFTLGEKPYHQVNLPATTGNSSNLLTADVQANVANPISHVAQSFHQSIIAKRNQMLLAMNTLVTGASKTEPTNGHASPDQEVGNSISSLAGSIGAIPAESTTSCLVINPHGAATRVNTTLSSPINESEHIYAVSSQGSQTDVTVDAPAFGYAIASGETLQTTSPSSKNKKHAPSAVRWLRDRFLGKSATIADHLRLHNEFMEVSISERTGGISGVYSGSVRGNRFSMRLVAVGQPSEAVMTSQSIRIAENTAAVGRIVSLGTVKVDQEVIADFEIQYTLRRGSRNIELQIELTSRTELSHSPWQNYLAVRWAVPNESAIFRSFLRDKIHRVAKQRLVAPAGVLIDEAERKTMICSHGHPYHRIVDRRFLDTLLHVRGETRTTSQFTVGMDVPQPIIAATQAMAPPVIQPVEVNASINAVGWFAHVQPSEMMLEGMSVHPLGDGRIAAEVRLIQTMAKSSQAKLRFFRDVAFAFTVQGDCQTMLEQWSDGSKKFADQALPCEGNLVRLSMTSHAVARVVVIFR